MELQRRILVTTALEETWPTSNVPVLFLGEWCRLHSRKFLWQNLDAVVANYCWDDREKLYKDYLYLQALYEELLELLVAKLNELHQVKYSVGYWRILVGPWLGYFIQILFERFEMLQQVFRENAISGVKVLKQEDDRFLCNDMENFVTLSMDDGWNEYVYGKILAYMGVSVEYVNIKNNQTYSSNGFPRDSLMKVLKKSFREIINKVSSFISREKDFFFITTYLGVRQELYLQIKLGQFPKLWAMVVSPKSSYNPAIRKWQIPNVRKKDDFFGLLCQMIPLNIPKVYVEGYQNLIALTENLPWPKFPKAIFTSNSFAVDDVFKAWSATKAEGGAPLIIGQHGGNYGMSKWSFFEEHEIKISSKYLTWGWSEDARQKLVPVGNLKNFCADKTSANDKGFACIIGMALPRYSYHMYSVPVASQLLSYFDDQYRFIAALPNELRDQLVVRLFPQDFGWSQKLRWRNRFPNIHIDDGVSSMQSLMKKSRIFISTYNATTYLETMCLNFPTIIFWDPKYWELRDSAVPYFDRLKAVGIFHATPESAAQQMESVWSDVSGWWQRPDVQLVRSEFCEHYARIPKDPLSVMESIFRRIVNEEAGGRASKIRV